MGYIEELRQLVGTHPLILVGAVVVLLDEQERVLLQQRTEPAGKWGLPGGLMEFGESTEETAKREVYEETGFQVEDLRLIGIFSGKNYVTKLANGDVFQSVTAAYYTRNYSGRMAADRLEGTALQFFPLDALPDYMVGSHRKMITAYQKLQQK
ncbi:NUDIX hydrolase [Ectobacillus ponti]|uniref:NUDIX hydrolase n=1 Tax=Ectobacillus ponti TaxID=2961894 RepID=A0AA41X138_9BACI|nr:NUDIX hydrolase [Ectobacillus ponti]MCP8967026.1 NUDIX hydrolase [Ectobacillus ponti]